MRSIIKTVSAAAAVLMLAANLAACTGSGQDYATPEPIVTPAPTATNDPSVPTNIPEWMQTPDPALYTPDENGFFEDQYFSVYWPSFLKFMTFSGPNSVNYRGDLESGNALVLNYTWDEGGSYEDEVAGFDAKSYEEYMQKNMNSYFYVEEFEYTKVDGHDALRVGFRYDPPETPDHLTHALMYIINVNGWIISINYTSLDELPSICDESVNTIKFKAGY